MTGDRQGQQEALFFDFSFERYVRGDLLQAIDRFVTWGGSVASEPGTAVAPTYRTAPTLPERFSRARGAHFGLTPRCYSSGQTDYDGRISHCGDAMVCTTL
jgi:hypothetical protein